MVMLPRVSCAGIWQIDTSSAHSIVEINSGVEFVRGLCGRIAHIPLTLRRLPRPLDAARGRQGRRGGYTLKLTFDLGVEELRRIHNGLSTDGH